MKHGKNKKITAVLAAVLCIFCLFFGCGKNKPRGGGDDGRTETLYIQAFDGGYGTAWLYGLKDLYEKEHGSVKVEIRATSYDDEFETTLLSGVANTDLFFGRYAMFGHMYEQWRNDADGRIYPCVLEDLTDVYETIVDGSAVKDRMLPEFLRGNEFTDDAGEKKYYTFPWVRGMIGILKNNKVWKPEWKVPNTTDELIALAHRMRDAGKKPFIYSLRDSYYLIYEPVFVAQYEGLERMERYWAGYDAKGQRYKPDFLVLDGQVESLKVMEELLKDGNGFQHPASKSLDFTAVQNMFLDDSENIAMMVNGDWIEREMAANYEPGEADIEFIKNPVISALGTKLGISDSLLSAVVDYVDGTVKTCPDIVSGKGVSAEEIIGKVREARSLIVTNSVSHCAWIPAYSDMKEEAKDFLRLMAGDAGIKTFVSSTGGYSAPYKFSALEDKELAGKCSPFIRSAIELMDSSVYYWPDGRDRIFARGHLLPHGNSGVGMEMCFSAVDAKYFKSAETYFAESCNAARERWEYYLQDAGLES